MERVASLTISAEMYGQVLRHVRKSLPREAVGLLGGRTGGQVTLVLPLPNIAPASRQFIADPFAQFCGLRRLEAEGLQLLAIYHSHPDGGVDPSEDDLLYARRWSCVHLIVTTREACRERLRAFCCNGDGSLEDVEIRLLV